MENGDNSNNYKSLYNAFFKKGIKGHYREMLRSRINDITLNFFPIIIFEPLKEDEMSQCKHLIVLTMRGRAKEWLRGLG